jgi:hypothetical protein
VAKSQIETEEEQIIDMDFLKTRHHLLWFSLKKTTALFAKANAFVIYVPPPFDAFVFLKAMESLLFLA